MDSLLYVVLMMAVFGPASYVFYDWVKSLSSGCDLKAGEDDQKSSSD